MSRHEGHWRRAKCRFRRRWSEGRERGESAFSSRNPHRLSRNRRRGLVLGVCAGIADYFGVKRGVVRAATVVGFIFIPWFVGIAYLALGFWMPVADPPELEAPPRAREDADFWRGVTIKPADTFSALRFRFRELEKRLAALETEVTHPDYDLKRQFRDL